MLTGALAPAEIEQRAAPFQLYRNLLPSAAKARQALLLRHAAVGQSRAFAAYVEAPRKHARLWLTVAHRCLPYCAQIIACGIEFPTDWTVPVSPVQARRR
jgi:hypothetical protein